VSVGVVHLAISTSIADGQAADRGARFRRTAIVAPGVNHMTAEAVNGGKPTDKKSARTAKEKPKDPPPGQKATRSRQMARQENALRIAERRASVHNSKVLSISPRRKLTQP
jgi:hypothetical protein